MNAAFIPDQNLSDHHADQWLNEGNLIVNDFRDGRIAFPIGIGDHAAERTVHVAGKCGPFPAPSGSDADRIQRSYIPGRKLKERLDRG